MSSIDQHYSYPLLFQVYFRMNRHFEMKKKGSLDRWQRVYGPKLNLN